MSKKIMSSLLILLGMYSLSAADAPVKIFLLAGQSNMDGCGKAAELPAAYKTMPGNVKTWDLKSKLWVPLTTDSFAKRRRLQFGPEVSFSHQVSKQYPQDQIRLIKVSAGGTSLYKGWLPGMGMNTRFVENIEAALANLETAGLTYSIEGLLWMQGESDTNDLENGVKKYHENFTTFKLQIRKLVNTPDLPIVVGRINTLILKSTKWKFKHTKEVQAQQEAIAKEDPRIELVLTDTFTCTSDNTHFDTQGEIDLGNAMYEALKKYFK